MHNQHNQRVGEVVATDEFRDWYLSLNDGDGRAVGRAVDRLEMMGVSLPFPYSSAIAGSRCALRELRAQSAGRPLRVFYIFDARRDAVLLVGGDKTGDDRFYETMIPTAERIWDTYRAEQGFEP
jgi:hypothetical protein